MHRTAKVNALMKYLALSIVLCFFVTSGTEAQDSDRKYPVTDIAWHPDGTKIAIAKGAWSCGPEPRPDILRVEIISYPEFESLYTIYTDLTCPIRNLEWSRDGQYLVMGERGWGKAYTWRLANQQIIAISEPFVTYDRYMDRIQPNGTVVANTTEAIGVSLWDLLTGQPIVNLSEEDSYGVSWSPDGTKLVFGTYISNEIRCAIAETDTYTVISTFDCMTANPLWSPDGQWIVTSTQETVYLWKALTFTLEKSWSEGHGGSTGNKWSHDSRYLANINADGSLTVRLMPQGTEIYILTGTGEITAFSWSPKGDILYGQAVLPNSLGVTLIPQSVINPSSSTHTPSACKDSSDVPILPTPQSTHTTSERSDEC